MNEPSEAGALASLLRGARLSPAFGRGIRLTFACAVIATAGRVVVPVAIQRVVDRGLYAAGTGPDLAYVLTTVALAVVVLFTTAVSAALMSKGLSRSTEAALADIRVRAFSHIHDLSVLTQNTERRGSLVSRVSDDIDGASAFMQNGGMILVVSAGQVAVATILMSVYSWQLTVLVLLAFLPLFLLHRSSQRQVMSAYSHVRERKADIFAAVAESIVGVATIRAFAAEDRAARRLDAAIDRHQRDSIRLYRPIALAFSAADIATGLATGVVVVAGVLLGIAGEVTVGKLLAFLFLITIFVVPVQAAGEVLHDAQNAIAGFRRVLALLDKAPDVADPGERGVTLPRGPIDVRFEGVRFRYPTGPHVLHGLDLSIAPGSRIAVVGETGSGKTTFAKLLARLMDPSHGRVLVDGVDLREVRFSSLRSRIVMVPQDGFLFDASLSDNIRLARPGASDADLRLALTSLGFSDWLLDLPRGLDTQVGQRGELLSAGQRQLVSLARAYLADPDLLLLDEATSSVDPATEMRLQRALDRLTRGRTSVTIAHRLSTAQAADEVLVFDGGRIVQRGAHAELVHREGPYARLFASWAAQHTPVG